MRLLLFFPPPFSSFPVMLFVLFICLVLSFCCCFVSLFSCICVWSIAQSLESSQTPITLVDKWSNPAQDFKIKSLRWLASIMCLGVFDGSFFLSLLLFSSLRLFLSVFVSSFLCSSSFRWRSWICAAVESFCWEMCLLFQST